MGQPWGLPVVGETYDGELNDINGFHVADEDVFADLDGARPGAIEEGSAGGGSDGNFTAALGVPTLDGFGAIGDGAHALHEHVEIDALAPRAAVISGVLHRIARA